MDVVVWQARARRRSLGHQHDEAILFCALYPPSYHYPHPTTEMPSAATPSTKPPSKDGLEALNREFKGRKLRKLFGSLGYFQGKVREERAANGGWEGGPGRVHAVCELSK